MTEVKGREHLVTLKVDAGVLFDALSKMKGDTNSLGVRLVSLLMGDDSFQTGVGLGFYGISEVDTEERLATLQAENEKLRALISNLVETHHDLIIDGQSPNEEMDSAIAEARNHIKGGE